MARKLRAIDLFCGAGGSSYGAQNVGFKISAGFDIWEPAIKTYRANFPQTEVFSADIRTLSPETIKARIGEVDLILASPECTNHSNAKGGGERCEESKETVFETVRFARAFRPKWVVIENVVQMQSWGRYSELLQELGALGYLVRDDVILNAKDFGVPQSRERLFLLCSLLGNPEPPDVTVQQSQAASKIIDTSGKYRFSPLRKPGRAEATVEKAERAIEALGADKPFLIVYYGSDKSGKGGWQRLDEPLRTITTLDRFAYVVPGENGHIMRMLQPEELKLAMGFKPDFQLSNIEGLTRKDRVKLMGNGVCPPVIETIIRSLISQLGQ